MLPHQSQKCALLAAMLLTPYKTTWLTAVSTHCLAALHAIAVCVEQSHVVLPLCCYAKALDCTIKNTRFTKIPLDYKYVTNLSDFKKIGVVLKNRLVFDEHYILNLFICLRPDGP